MTDTLDSSLDTLKLIFTKENYQTLAKEAVRKGSSHVKYLTTLMEGEALNKQDRSTARRIHLARFPVKKTLDQFDWSHPKQINKLQVQNLFRLQFIENKENVTFIGGVGLGKTHLSIALGHAACLKGYSVLFTSAVEAVNTLSAAIPAGRLKQEITKYTKPSLLILDELGYLPIDKRGADLLFQIISARYEQGSIVITTNRTYKHWAEIFNNDATLTSALLDRFLHHSETVTILGKSRRASKIEE